MKEYLSNLNKEQYEAATSLDGYYLVYAGAGSGKTTALTARVANLLDAGIPGTTIMLLTFTNKAAKEMRDRVERMIGHNAKDVTACTFHSFCANFMRKNASIVDIPNDFSIIDSTDATSAMGIVREDYIDEQKKAGVKYELKDFPSAKLIFGIYSTAINSCQAVTDVIVKSHCKAYEEEIKTIINKYIKYKKEKDLMDYDDLLYYTEYVMTHYEKIRTNLNERYQYIMCDEYQDTNRIQEKILGHLTEQTKNLMVVGDCNQSIYKFRCAEIQNILTFKNRYPGCKAIVLHENYRSTQEILDLPNCFMQYAVEGDQVTLHGQKNDKKPILKIVDSKNAEENFVLDKIEEYHRNGMPLKEMAVIVRSAMQTYGLEAKLAASGIHFEKFGGIKFLEKPVVKDALSFLRITENEKDEIALFRILQLYPGIGKGFAKKIAVSVAESGLDNIAEQYKKKKFYEYLVEMIETVRELRGEPIKDQLYALLDGYYAMIRYRTIQNSDVSDVAKATLINDVNKEIENAKAIYDLCAEYKTTKAFLDDVVLDAAVKDKDDDYLNITTVHSCKGLEYSVVFIMDVVEGVTPKSKKDSEEDPEELRVFYVACTRAKDKLFLIAPMAIGPKMCKLSHFINEDDIIENVNVEGNELQMERLRYTEDVFDKNFW